MKDFIVGFQSFFKAFTKLGSYSLWPLFWVSGILSATVGCALFYFVFSFDDNVANFVVQKYPFEFGKPQLIKVGEYLGTGLLFLVAFFVYKYIVLVVLSPILSLISQKVENKIGNPKQSLKSGIGGFVAEILRGILVSLRSAFKEIFLTVVLLILGLFPLLTIIAGPMILLVQAYYLGFGSFDYFMERYHGVGSSIKIGSSNKMLYCGVGMGFILLLFIPILGFVVGPIMATISATELAIARNLNQDMKFAANK